MNKTPYLHVVDQPRLMKGKGAPRSTVFGVLGRTAESPYSKSLGGLVMDSKASASVQRGTLHRASAVPNTDRHIGGPAAKTHIAGAHYGQVPYAGAYMAGAGREL